MSKICDGCIHVAVCIKNIEARAPISECAYNQPEAQPPPVEDEIHKIANEEHTCTEDYSVYCRACIASRAINEMAEIKQEALDGLKKYQQALKGEGG